MRTGISSMEGQNAYAITRALADARATVGRAITALDMFPDSVARQALIDLAEFVIERTQ